MHMSGGIADSRSVPLVTVFDLDDTLIDSGDAWDSTCAAYTAARGHRWTAADAAALHGNGGWAAYVAGLCGGLPPARVAADCTQAMIARLAGGGITLLPGAARLVSVAVRFGPLALVTGSPRQFALAAIARFGLAGSLGAVVGAEDVAQPKPAPDPYLRAAAALGAGPRDCVAVEDSSPGIRSAHAAGITVLAIPRAGRALPPDIAALAACQARDAGEAASLLPLLHQRARAHVPAPAPAPAQGAWR
jgi:HAD superfamily hydrolase (TIGR01509 family)